MFYRKILAPVLLSLLSGLLLTLSFPDHDLSWLAWIALVPLLLAIRNQPPGWSFALCLLGGIAFFMGHFYWINVIQGFKLSDFILLGLYLGSYFGLFGLLLGFLSRATRLSPVYTAPCIWVSMEYLRSNASFLALPWGLLGHSQYLNLTLIQIASWTGVYGVSFAIVMVNAAVSELILSWVSKKRGTSIRISREVFKQGAVVIVVLGISLAYGFSVTANMSAADRIRVTVIQGNIPQEIRWEREYLKRNLERHVSLTREAANSGNTALIVWPETSVQGSLVQDLSLFGTISDLARETGASLLVGSSVRPKFGSREFRRRSWFNSAFLISPRGAIEGQYNKIYLLPFAEYLPHKDFLPWPSRIAAGSGPFLAGKEYTVFSLNGAGFAVTICWESIFPDIFRRFVKNGAEFMVNITNEAWFGETAAPYQFLAMNVFRAIENRVSIARSANTGISALIDPYGRVLAKVENGGNDIFVEGHATREIPLSKQKTFYTFYGDIFAYMNLIATAMVLAVSMTKRRLRAAIWPT